MSDSFEPMDCNPPVSSAHGIFQARIQESGGISCSKGFYSLPLAPPGKPPSTLCANSLQLCLTLLPMDCSLPGSSVHGISRPEYWSGLPFPSPGDLPDPRIKPGFLGLLHRPVGSFPLVGILCAVLSHSVVSDSLRPPWAVAHQAPLSLGIPEAGILEWVVMPSSRRSSHPRDRTTSPTLQADSLPAELPRKPRSLQSLGIIHSCKSVTQFTKKRWFFTWSSQEKSTER